ncbi:biliverdin-producing heme oxygenase [Variovorax rhizosphaerae]|uniref:Biliverdin-producing heme oxygenase n=1 Tax=Variovorax rhizosphaerae TaxID=1836200 RepID=A0ABU8WTZ3_9BURK
MTPTSPLSESLKNETRDLHTQAERSAFMQVLLRGKMDRTAYGAMLRNLHAIYAAMESVLARHAHDPLLAPLVLPGLPREAALRHDLDALFGNAWHRAYALEPAAQRYVARLQAIEEARPGLLAAHSYVRYLGDLSGGQILARIVRESMGLPAGEGTAFYAFGDAAATAHLRKAYRAGLAVLRPDDATRRAIVDEARLAFELHCALFDELAQAYLQPALALGGGPLGIAPSRP